MKSVQGLSLAALLWVVTLTASVSGCDLLCVTGGCRPDGRLDGTWRLSTVNARPISTYQPGYPIKNTDQYIWGADLDFYTGRWDSNKHWGTVMLSFFVKNVRGIQQERKGFTGTFEYNKGTGELTLAANGGSFLVRVAGSTITASHGLPSVEEITATLVRSSSE